MARKKKSGLMYAATGRRGVATFNWKKLSPDECLDCLDVLKRFIVKNPSGVLDQTGKKTAQKVWVWSPKR